MRSASPPAATTTGSDSRPDRLHVLGRQELVEAGVWAPVLGGAVDQAALNRQLPTNVAPPAASAAWRVAGGSFPLPLSQNRT
jgi:hypothetical protein